MNDAFRFLCLALRVGYGSEQPARLRQAIAAGPDWPAIVAEANVQRVVPLFFDSLREAAPSETPPDVLADLRKATLLGSALALAQCRRVALLSTAFEAAGVRMLALKGVALAAQLYGDPTRRGAGDIDLLIDPKQILEADAVLCAAGYQRLTASRLSPQRRASYMRWRKDFLYVHPTDRVLVELHHRLAENPNLINYDFAELWNERETIMLGTVTVATLSRRVLRTYLCVHGAQHYWSRLRWLADFRTLLDGPTGVSDFLAEAESTGSEVLALEAALLAHQWLGLPLSAAMLERAEGNRQVVRLHRRVLRFPVALARRVTFSSPSQYLRVIVAMKTYGFWLRPGWSYRAMVLACAFFRPEDGDTARLPDRIFWLYPALRPVMWAIRSYRRIATPTKPDISPMHDDASTSVRSARR